MNLFSYKKQTAVIALVIYALIAAGIFMLALQTGEQSSALSHFISAVLSGIDLSHEKTETDIEKVDLTDITLSADKAAYYIGEKVTLTVGALPENFTEGYTFTSSDEHIAKVSDTGVVDFLAFGNVTITVTGAKGVVTDDLSLEVYKSGSDIDNLDFTQFSLNTYDVLPANDCKAVSVRYKDKPISLDFSLVSTNESVLSTRGSYVLTHSEGECEILLVVGEETIARKQMTVTNVTLAEPLVKNLYLGGEKLGDTPSVVYLGRNYQLNVSLFNDEQAVRSYILSSSDKNVRVTYSNSASVVILTPESCGENTFMLYSRTNLDHPVADFSVSIIPPRAVVEAIEKPASGFLCGSSYKLNLIVADKNSLVGYDYEVFGKNATVNESGRVTFNKAGEYRVVFSSSYYPEDVFEFVIIAIDNKAESAFRKQLGHFGLFAALGLFGVLSLGYFSKKPAYKAIITLFCGLMVAAVSEVLQLPIFTVARGFSAIDILIDFGGYLAGAAIMIATLIIIYLIRSRRESSSPTDA